MHHIGGISQDLIDKNIVFMAHDIARKMLRASARIEQVTRPECALRADLIMAQAKIIREQLSVLQGLVVKESLISL